MAPIWHSCYTCRDYATHRRDVLAAPLADKAQRAPRHCRSCTCEETR